MEERKRNDDDEEYNQLLQFLQHPIENEQKILQLLGKRFELIQQKQQKIYSLNILEPGTTESIQITSTDSILLRIPLYQSYSK